MPQKGTLTADQNGEMSQSEVLAQAAALGLQNVVVGTIGLSTSGDSEVRADAALRLLNTASGKVQGEIHKELAVGDSSNNKAASELAAFVVPQLDRQLRESSQSVSVTGSPAEPEEAGELVVQIKSTDAYAAWLSVEKMLREHFQNLSVKGLEIRPKECIVRLLGADGTSLKKLNGTRLSNGAQVQITSLGAGDHSFGVSLAKSEGSPVEPSQ
jgi:hypothetical protein